MLWYGFMKMRLGARQAFERGLLRHRASSLQMISDTYSGTKLLCKHDPLRPIGSTRVLADVGSLLSASLVHGCLVEDAFLGSELGGH